VKKLKAESLQDMGCMIQGSGRKMQLSKGKITRDTIALLDKWRHTGFNVYSGPHILPRYEKSWKIWPDTSSGFRSFRSE